VLKAAQKLQRFYKRRENALPISFRSAVRRLATHGWVRHYESLVVRAISSRISDLIAIVPIRRNVYLLIFFFFFNYEENVESHL